MAAGERVERLFFNNLREDVSDPDRIQLVSPYTTEIPDTQLVESVINDDRFCPGCSRRSTCSPTLRTEGRGGQRVPVITGRRLDILSPSCRVRGVPITIFFNTEV